MVLPRGLVNQIASLQRGSIYDAQSMTALLRFPREQRTSIWPDTGALFARKK